jgi:hypothetical protein
VVELDEQMSIEGLGLVSDAQRPVDLDVDHRSRCFHQDPATARRSTYKVKEGVDVQRRRSDQRLRDNVKVDVHVFARTFAVSSTPVQRIDAPLAAPDRRRGLPTASQPACGALLTRRARSSLRRRQDDAMTMRRARGSRSPPRYDDCITTQARGTQAATGGDAPSR